MDREKIVKGNNLLRQIDEETARLDGIRHFLDRLEEDKRINKVMNLSITTPKSDTSLEVKLSTIKEAALVELNMKTYDIECLEKEFEEL